MPQVVSHKLEPTIGTSVQLFSGEHQLDDEYQFSCKCLYPTFIETTTYLHRIILQIKEFISQMGSSYHITNSHCQIYSSFSLARTGGLFHAQNLMTFTAARCICNGYM